MLIFSCHAIFTLFIILFSCKDIFISLHIDYFRYLFILLFWCHLLPILFDYLSFHFLMPPFISLPLFSDAIDYDYLHAFWYVVGFRHRYRYAVVTAILPPLMIIITPLISPFRDYFLRRFASLSSISSPPPHFAWYYYYLLMPLFHYHFHFHFIRHFLYYFISFHYISLFHFYQSRSITSIIPALHHTHTTTTASFHLLPPPQNNGNNIVTHVIVHRIHRFGFHFSVFLPPFHFRHFITLYWHFHLLILRHYFAIFHADYFSFIFLLFFFSSFRLMLSLMLIILPFLIIIIHFIYHWFSFTWYWLRQVFLFIDVSDI